eukprot:TRINITY_DN7322_c0_g1_i1.p1 TRINITY_DN7322_c0_g1~~TRINITY_DN7322_c0_g1_i1.p1  ORF type:complete len:216 (+),score=41.28 TRINITY_DN7322_c0_g1_i1:61-708(+)
MTEQYKICLLGEGRVGKTSLVRRFTKDEFFDKQESTVQASMFAKKKLSVDDRMVNVAVWDTAGQERFHALGPIYYRDANGAVLVYDITDKDTFDRVKHWVKELKSVVGEDIELAVAGNKCDLDRNRQVTIDEALKFCKTVGAEHFSTSAKLNKNVTEVFQDITTRMARKRAKQSSGTTGGRAASGARGAQGGGRNAIRIVEDDAPPPAESRKCCG